MGCSVVSTAVCASVVDALSRHTARLHERLAGAIEEDSTQGRLSTEN